MHAFPIHSLDNYMDGAMEELNNFSSVESTGTSLQPSSNGIEGTQGVWSLL